MIRGLSLRVRVILNLKKANTIGPVEKFTERNGISGGHNYDEFKNYFNSNSNKYELGPVVKKEHPDIDGIFEIEYKVKYEKMDYT
ncbi:hypothetical protein V7034_24175, partial [Priestia megaterium]